jgi:Ricin-type beta-trefoil lectin domain-like
MTRLMRTNLLALISLALLFVAAGSTLGQPPDPNTQYQIVARHSGKCLAVAGGNRFINNGVGVIQWNCIDTEDNQKWRILPVGFGYYKIIAKHSGKSLEVRGGIGALTNGDPVQQWDYVGNPNQQWWLNPVGDGFYQIVAAHSKKSLDVNGGPGATGDGPHTQQWDYWGADNQKWKLIPQRDTVTGTFTYTDTEIVAGRSAAFDRPIVRCRVQVWRGGVLAATTQTDNTGRFSTTVPHTIDGTDTRVVLYATNEAAQILAGSGPFFVTTPGQLSNGGMTLDFSKKFDTVNEVRSFNAAHNIRLAFDFARARRDPRETEMIPRVDVSFMDHDAAGTRYNHPASSLLIHYTHNSSDLVIMHEYAHFLEDKIGGFLLLPSYHDTCFTTQRCLTAKDCAELPGTTMTQLVNSPENAWMEGFANYFAMAVKRANPSGRFNLTPGGTMTEAELNDPGSCGAVGRFAFDGRLINGEMIEKFVASVLWRISDGGFSDVWVFRIFDRELDGSATGVLPNIKLFHDKWVARGLDHASLDRILREQQIPTVAIH